MGSLIPLFWTQVLFVGPLIPEFWTQVLFVGPLIYLFWTSGGGIHVTYSLRFTSGATPANLLAASVAAELISYWRPIAPQAAWLCRIMLIVLGEDKAETESYRVYR